MKKKRSTASPDNFFERVYQVVRQIPKGRVTSYGAIADYLGTGLSARMVGWAMNASHLSLPPVPAHRVLNRQGRLTGKHHFSTPVLMQELLENEGLIVVADQVQGFRERFWDPANTLKAKKNSRKSLPKVKRPSRA